MTESVGSIIGERRGIPTLYNGVQFRSRLEARWAAFFDVLKWEWDYEPLDLAGYIPDFVLPFRHAPLLVEVKPTATYQVGTELRASTPKIMASGWASEAWVVGSRLGDIGCGEKLGGILGSRERDSKNDEWLWDDALLMWCVPCRGFSVAQMNGSWRCRRCGIDDGKHRGHPPCHLLDHAWIDAGNAVQWRRP